MTALPPVRLLRPRAVVPVGSSLASMLELQAEANRVVVARQRALRKEATASSVSLMHASRRMRALSVRDEWDEATGKDITKALSQEERVATEAEVHAFSVKLNIALCREYPEARTQVVFFQLFEHMDRDRSGLVSWLELMRMIRELLRIPPEELSESDVCAPFPDSRDPAWTDAWTDAWTLSSAARNCSPTRFESRATRRARADRSRRRGSGLMRTSPA